MKTPRPITLYVESVSHPSDIGFWDRISEIDIELSEEQIKKLLELISDTVQSGFPRSVRLRLRGRLVL